MGGGSGLEQTKTKKLFKISTFMLCITILLCHLLACMDFGTDGFWPVISHQLINQSAQMLRNKFLALRFQ